MLELVMEVVEWEDNVEMIFERKKQAAPPNLAEELVEVALDSEEAELAVAGRGEEVGGGIIWTAKGGDRAAYFSGWRVPYVWELHVGSTRVGTSNRPFEPANQ
ncbi:hypothetical protein AMTR_s00002p00271520 [Amborella trichopoda]|uniref:Uncharacterized protein n=1 Tax=Amborella trichopoda TaxID=13333 RepID=W1P0T7_AMBTC|nr:hypothetical protein AMTR_s00002p00271520 [Amborella trichopoda]